MGLRGYRGLQEVKRGDRGLLKVTGVYNGLREVTRGDRGLQVVTRGYSRLQGVARGYSGSTRLQGVTDVARADMGLLEVRGGSRG